MKSMDRPSALGMISEELYDALKGTRLVEKASAGPCPICGLPMTLKGTTLKEMYVSHRCPQSVLNAIDAQYHRDEDEPCELSDPTNRSEREKRKDASKDYYTGDRARWWEDRKES